MLIGKQDETLFLQLLKVYIGRIFIRCLYPRCRRMDFIGNQEHSLIKNNLIDKSVNFVRNIHQGKINLIFPDQSGQRIGMVFMQNNPHVRVGRGIGGQNVGKQDGAPPRRHADIENLSAACSQFLYLRFKLPRQISHPFQITQIQSSGIRQDKRSVAAVEQFHLKLLLQPADTLAEIRLRQIQFFRCPGNTSFSGDRKKILRILRIHLFSSLSGFLKHSLCS